MDSMDGVCGYAMTAGATEFKPQQHRRFHMSIPKRILAFLPIIGLCWSALPICAQDPFEVDGLTADAPPETPAVERNANTGANSFNSSSERSAVVLSLRANPPKTHAELARAIQWMMRIRRWDEVQHWLNQVEKLGVNEAAAVQMTQVAGSQTFIRLTGPEADLSDSQRLLVRKILDLATAASTNPKKLNSYVLQLRSENKAERVAAFRAIQGAGNNGIAALLNHLISEQATAPNPAMCETFALMGKQANAAWLAAMLTPDANARGRLAQLAVRVGDPALTTALCAAAVDERIESSVRQELSAIAAKNNKSLPSIQQVHRHAIDQMRRALRDYQQVRWQDEADAFTLWKLSPDGRTLTEGTGQIADLHWVRAVQHASTGLLTGGGADIDSAMALAVLTEQMAETSPETASVEAAAANSLPKLMRDSFEFACLVWDAAEKQNLPSAQMLAVRNLGRWAQPETFPNAVRDRLAQALRSGLAPVRYESASALVQAMITTEENGTLHWTDIPFDGRNRLEKILSEMRRLEARPLALVIGGNSDLRTHARGLLEAFSYRVAEAASASQTLEELRSGQPIEAIVIVEHVLEMDLGQLIQRIRAFPATSSCPIALLAESLSRGEHSIAGTDPKVVMGSVPPEQAGFADILRRVRVVSQLPPIDAARRIAWNDLANIYWEQIQSQYVSANPKPLFRPQVESPIGQLKLIEIVKDASKPLPQREQASQIFVQSVKQFGLLISTETANAQYDEYNKRGPDEPELLAVLGRVLDAMEAAKGSRPWSEVAP